MLKFINLKNLTAFTFMAFLTAGLIVQPATANNGRGNGNGNGNNSQSCNSNNGHGNNADIPLTLSTGTTLTVTRFDPSNPGGGDYIGRRINAANSSLTPAEFLEAKNQLQQLVNDVELNGQSSNGSNCDDSSNNNNETTPEVGGDNARILDWSEVLAADPDGWVTDSG
ncbi:MAG: hypothetical protein QNJ72_06710, partial [Pleurocapsa sp. MO_226.B13]|nr:hypothetical protein [Pleurocapsa sp. MO_226.B13]